MLCRHSTLRLGGRRAGRRLLLAAARGEPDAGEAVVVLKKGKGALFRGGQPLVFAAAVDRVVGRPPPQAGDSVWLADGAGERRIGWGAFNPHSLFRVRVLELEGEPGSGGGIDVAGLLRRRIGAAAALRRTLGLPSPATTVYRLLNSEGDRVSGLTADVLGGCLVVCSSAAWVERHRGLIEGLLREATGLDQVQWRPMVGFLREEGLEVPEPRPDPEAGDVEVCEEGVRYYAAPLGQKTGFYADQRDSRALLRRLAGGRTVLDLCCYSGGFALSAALGGAADVTGVDSSGPAIALAARNLALNGLDPERCRFVKADVLDFLRASRGEPPPPPRRGPERGEGSAAERPQGPAEPPDALEAAPAEEEGSSDSDNASSSGSSPEAAATARRWDIVILDPPKLAPKRSGLQRALIAYKRMNTAALRAVAPGGLLMTCSCSGAVAQSGSLLPTVRAAAAAAGRHLTLLRAAGAAADHPLDPAYPEGAYLTNLLFRVQ